MAIPWGAIISAAGSIVGGALGSKGAKDASKAQAAASAQELALYRDIYNSQLGLNEPFRATGQGANNLLAQLYGLPYYDYSPAQQLGGGGAFGSGPITVKGSPPGGTLGNIFKGEQMLGLFGGGGPTRTWGGQNLLTGKQVYRLASQGMKAEDIAKLGLLQSSLNVDAINNLMRAGLSADDIAMLQRGPQADTGDGGMPAGYHPGTGQADLSVFQTSPGYQFRMNEGQRGIEQSAAARGGALSGNALRSLTEFNQNFASNDFYNFVNQMNNMAGRGQTAVTGQQNAGTNFANFGGNAIGNAGAARASGIANSANMWGQAIGGVADAVGGYFAGRQQPYTYNPAANTAGGLPDISKWYGWRW